MRLPVKQLCAVLLLAASAKGDDDRVTALEKKLADAASQMAQLQSVIEGLRSELGELKRSAPSQSFAPVVKEDAGESYVGRILIPELGRDERESELSGRPELFVQSRYQALPVSDATSESIKPNFVLTRMETRWSGRLSDKVGMGFEIQYHPAPAGAAFELVNDAFVEYYPTDAVTIRAGQFVKPFGFDIQQSSSRRESPERGIFAGYFFPGQRDRGLLVTTKLDRFGGALRGVKLYAGAFNGNRFFQDNNRQLNYNFRMRKAFESIPVAVGASVQLGRQILPEGMGGNNRENVYGADVQWVWGRLGVRAEYVVGNMPSTLLDIEPEFAPAFRPGAHSAGGAVFANLRLTSRDDVYWRYDQFNGDPVSGLNVKAFNFGYLRAIGKNSRFGIDFQFKNRASFNDDDVNTRLQISWNVVY